MKKTYLLIGMILLFLVIIWLLRQPKLINSPVTSSSPQPSPLPSPLSISLNSNQYHIYLQKIDPEKLTLIPNFSEQKTTQNIMQQNDCTYGVNAGFYTTDHKPLGIFISDKQSLQTNIHANALFNGFIYKTKTGKIEITDNQPDASIDWIFQSGPLFTPDRKLTIKDDESARRILVGKTDLGDFYFLAITETNNTNSGPLLADLPEIIQLFNKLTTTHPPLTTILNLDGGSASAFYGTGGTKLQELVLVGSFLCGK